MAQYLMHDRDKAAFTNRVNRLLGQLDPPSELDSTNFIDIPGDGEDDKCIFVTDSTVEEQLLDAMIGKRKFSYSIKKINLQEIVRSLKTQA